jgi:hypothetical protein
MFKSIFTSSLTIFIVTFILFNINQLNADCPGDCDGLSDWVNETTYANVDVVNNDCVYLINYRWRQCVDEFGQPVAIEAEILSMTPYWGTAGCATVDPEDKLRIAITYVLATVTSKVGFNIPNMGMYNIKMRTPSCWSIDPVTQEMTVCEGTTCCTTDYTLTYEHLVDDIIVINQTHEDPVYDCVGTTGNEGCLNLCSSQDLPEGIFLISELTYGGGTCPDVCYWNLHGNDINPDMFLGTKNDLPVVIKANNQEVMRIQPLSELGQVGIWQSNPKEPLQIGEKMTFHIGNNYNFLGDNVFYNATQQRERIVNGSVAALEFSHMNEGWIDLVMDDDDVAGTLVDYNESTGGLRGMRLVTNTTDKFAHIGLGTAPSAERVFIRGFGNTDATASLRISNSDNALALFVRDDSHVGIRNDDPKDILHVGSQTVFHDGGSKGIYFNAYYDGTATKNIEGGRASVALMTDDISAGTSAGLVLRVDRNATTGANLFSSSYENCVHFLPDAYVGIGVWTPTARLNVKGTTNDATAAAFFVQNSDDDPLMYVRNDGNVGIGTNAPKYTLHIAGDSESINFAVEGIGYMEELVIKLKAEWPDYVFSDNYKLIPLGELESNIKANGHLTGIPSAEEVSKNGIVIGEMQAQLLRKIEELHLYVIELKKANDNLKNDVEILKDQVKK